jgi:hypothetical protein
MIDRLGRKMLMIQIDRAHIFGAAHDPGWLEAGIGIHRIKDFGVITQTLECALIGTSLHDPAKGDRVIEDERFRHMIRANCGATKHLDFS